MQAEAYSKGLSPDRRNQKGMSAWCQKLAPLDFLQAKLTSPQRKHPLSTWK